MTAKKAFIVGFAGAVVLISCSGFKYTYYGIHPSQGLLLGKTEIEDRPLMDCEPDAEGRDGGKCVVLFVDEFERVRADMIELKERLKACEEAD